MKNNTSEKLRNLADKMQEQIDGKRNPACNQQNWTRRRADMATSMARDAEHLEKIQILLRSLADLHETGIDENHLLFKVKTKSAVTALLRYSSWPRWEKDQKTLARAGITPENVTEAHNLLLSIVEFPDYEKERKRKELENKARSLIGVIQGFFPTPTEIVDRMLELAYISDGMTVLEPSAGNGAIADIIATRYPNSKLETIEVNATLHSLLKEKGYSVIGYDFLETNGKWDRIIMNPPFENLQDTEHIRHAFDCLADDGILVSICSESPMFRNDKKAAMFREWLNETEHIIESLDPGSFANSGTNVKANIVVVYK